MNKKMFFILITLGLFSNHYLSAQTIANGEAEVNGTRLFYELSGSGETIVFVHGNEGDRRHWDFQFMPLAKDFRVIRYDVRGYGKSALPDPEEPYNDYEDMKALMDYLGIDKAHVCGLSMGSGIVVDFALAYPEMCRSLIPIGPWANGYGVNDFKSDAVDSLFVVMGEAASLAREKGAKEATDYFWFGNSLFKQTVRSEKALEHLLNVGYDYSWWGFINESKRGSFQPIAMTQLNKIEIPTLVITAEYDLEVCKEIAEIMGRKIKGSEVIAIQDAGHMMNIEKPEEFNTTLLNFINSIE
jgi:pimeloyl-ACP methyl ester carboxylesterase